MQCAMSCAALPRTAPPLPTREMRNPQKVFEERYSCENIAQDDDSSCDQTLTRVIRRPAKYDDDAQLPENFFAVAGDCIYGGLVNGFRGEVFGGPPPAPRGASLDDLLVGVTRILDIFKDRGYCLDYELSKGGADLDLDDAFTTRSSGGSGSRSSSSSGDPVKPGAFTVKITGPATLWGLGALASQRALIANTHDVMAVAAYLRASGRSSTRQLELTDAGYVERWQVL